MFLHIFEFRVQNKNEILERKKNCLESFNPRFFKKKCMRGASENTRKNKAKSNKNMKLSPIFGGFRGLKDSSYQIYEATFQQAIFP